MVRNAVTHILKKANSQLTSSSNKRYKSMPSSHMGDWINYDHVGQAKCNPEDKCILEQEHSEIYMWTIPKNVPEDLRGTPSADNQGLR